MAKVLCGRGVIVSNASLEKGGLDPGSLTTSMVVFLRQVASFYYGRLFYYG